MKKGITAHFLKCLETKNKQKRKNKPIIIELFGNRVQKRADIKVKMDNHKTGRMVVS